MTLEGYREVLQKCASDFQLFELTAKVLHEADQAKQILRDKGYGYTGLSLLETVKSEVPESDK
jgi:hypothetical protein